MLKLLIALMNEAYSKVRGNFLAQWRYEQTSVILDEVSNLAKRPEVPAYVHVLKPA